MLSLLTIIVFAQSSITLQVGNDKKDSVSHAKADSIAVRREARRDSMRVREHARDSVRKAQRIANRPPLTPAVFASAYKDPRARDLLFRARAARLYQDSTLTGYDANT